MKVLLIEDDAEMADYVAVGFRQEGHIVEIATNGQDAIILASGLTHDILIVDRRLPDMDGLNVVHTFRANGGTAPVIFLTTMSSIDDRVEGFEAGGDDYLIKPFAFSELRARVYALGRRPPVMQTETILRVGDLEMDLLRRRVTRSGQEIDLQPLEFRILEYLIRNKGRVVTRTMLLDRVWDFHFDPKTKVVEANISRLRNKIDRPFDQPLLHTLRGSGYILEPVDAGK
ncbi:MAG: response regulator transcription factor [Alphaproteobacteria bacterium]